MSLFRIRWSCFICNGLGFKGHNGPLCWQCFGRGWHSIAEVLADRSFLARLFL
jgi:hypothetical protein